MLAKPGRMYYNISDCCFEIPPELKIPTCIKCGTVNEDVWLKTKLEKISASASKNGGLRHATLNYIDESIRNIFKRPKMYGEAIEILLQLFVYLELRHFIVYKEKMKSNIYDTDSWKIVQNTAKLGNTFERLSKLDLDDVVIPLYRVFVDHFVFVEGAISNSNE